MIILLCHHSQQNLDEMNLISLKSYCNLFNLSIADDIHKSEVITILSSFTANEQNDDALQQNTESMESTNNTEDSDTLFGFQMDADRLDSLLVAKEEMDEKLIEIDDTKSFLHQYPIDISTKVSYSNGSNITFETSRIGHLSESAIIINCKGTIVYTTACSKFQSDLKFEDNLDLKVDAHERSWPRGYIPSGVQRNDGGITDYEILLCRMIDRSIRPLFVVDDDKLSNKIIPAYEVQILSHLLSCDDVYDTQVLSINGASAAVYLSPNIDIGDNGPIGAVRCIMDKNGEMIANPTKQEIEDIETKCNLLYVGTKDNCVMIETDSNRINEEEYCKLLQFAQDHVKDIVESIELLKKQNEELNQTEKELKTNQDIMDKYTKLSELKASFLSEEIVRNKETEIFELYSSGYDKNARNSRRDLLKKDMVSLLSEAFPDGYDVANDSNISESILSSNEWIDFYQAIFYEIDRKQFRNAYVTNNTRCDGRKFDELRDLKHMVDILPSCHGSALFQRGNTQTLCSATVGPPRLARMRDMHKPNHPEVKQRLYFQYEMPPAATNEIKAIQSKNRRAIGHGNIALNALKPLLPSFEDFPYSIRVYSNITASDGSSSMASVCGGSLSLMDAGIPMTEPAAGISIGLMNDILLTDIAGIEDHFGDMDFKIAGTKNGINSVQLDIKRGNGIPMNIIFDAVKSAKNTRLQILESMNQTITESKPDLKMHAPRVEIIDVPFRDLPRVIGSGGAVKQQIQIETKCDINIFWEEERVEITAPNIVCLNKAKRAIADVIGSQCRIGDIITVKIINIQSYGVMIQMDDGSEHLVHISQWLDNMSRDPQQNNMEYQEGQQVDVMCIGFLGENRPNFSRKAAVWQLSDDPEDRARLRLMLDSLRPPARSRAHPGASGGGMPSTSSSGNGGMYNGGGMTQREPSSIFSDISMDIMDINDGGEADEALAGLKFDQDIDNTNVKVVDLNEDEDDGIESDEDSTHPTILPPKQGFGNNMLGSKRNPRKSRMRSRNDNIGNNGLGLNDSIKDLVDNITSNKGTLANQESRFANLYQDIHSGKQTETQNLDGLLNNIGSLKSNGTMFNGNNSIDSSRYKQEENKNDNNDNIETWKSFTNDLLSSSANTTTQIEKDEEGDDLLTDLFGDQHKPDSNTTKTNKSTETRSRASALMDALPDLIQELNDEEQQI